MMLNQFSKLQEQAMERWQANEYLEYNKKPYTEESEYLRSVKDLTPWVKYEHYMFARLIATNPGQIGLLHIRFPAEMAEDCRLHTHFYSDRLITVMEGSGDFLVADKSDELTTIHLKTGMRLWMPRGVRHTFFAGKEGLVLESIHNPFVAFDDPKLLEYEKDAGFLERLDDGRYIEKKLAAV